MNVLGRMIEAVRPGGLILDLQVIRPNPRIELNGRLVAEIDGEALFRWADAATAAVDARIRAGDLVEEAVDDHDVREHYTDGAELVEDFAPSKRRIPEELVPASRRSRNPSPYASAAASDDCVHRQHASASRSRRPGDGRGSVAEDGGCLVADPVPERRCPADARVRDELGIVESARVDAERTEEQLAAAIGVLLEEPLQRRAALTSLALRLAREPDPDRVLRQEHRHLLAPVDCRDADEKRDHHTLSVFFDPGSQVDYDLCGHELLPSSR